MSFEKLIWVTIKCIQLYRVQLLKALLIPFILSILLDLLALAGSNIFIIIIYYVLTIMLQTIFAVTTHRIMLLGPNHVPEWGILKWSRRESAFAIYGVLLASIFYLILFLPFLFIMFSQAAVLFFIVPIIYGALFIPRLSLVFPAIAIGESYSLKDSWSISKNYKKIMFFSVILIPLIVSIPVVLISYIPYTFLIVAILSYSLTVISVSALSVSYKFITLEISKDS